MTARRTSQRKTQEKHQVDVSELVEILRAAVGDRPRAEPAVITARTLFQWVSIAAGAIVASVAVFIAASVMDMQSRMIVMEQRVFTSENFDARMRPFEERLRAVEEALRVSRRDD